MIATLILIIPTYKVFLLLQIECAIKREKSAFDHINTDWNLPNEDGSTDFSDDETVIDERVSIWRGIYIYMLSYHHFPTEVTLTSTQFCWWRFAGLAFTLLHLRFHSVEF